MHIVFTSSKTFVRQLLVASGSAVYACRGGGANPLVVHVLDCGITEADWADYESRIKALAARVKVEVDVVRHVIDMAIFKDLPAWHGSKALWTRILVPDILPDVDRCVFSDCDMLFVANPEEMLESLNDSNVYLAGHQSGFPRDESFPGAVWCRKNNLPFNPAVESCAGLLSMNLAALRVGHFVEKCLDFAAHHLDVPLADETTLNCVCFEHRALLPEGWGLYPWECHSLAGCIKSIHYVGGLPWKDKYDSYLPVISLKLSKKENALWHDFETKILGVSPSIAAVPSLRLRVLASAMVFCERMANLFGIKIGQARMQRIIAAYDGHSTSLATARQELFGDIERWR